MKFSTTDLVASKHILLVTDELPSLADFVLQKMLSTEFKDNNKTFHKFVLLSVSQDLSWWKAIAAKSVSPTVTGPAQFMPKQWFMSEPHYKNVNLMHHLSTGSFVFVDVLDEVEVTPATNSEGSPTVFGPVFDIVSEEALLDENSSDDVRNEPRKLVILDDITSLQWIGFPLLELVRFSRALRALCLKVDRCLRLLI
jgi:hypothetical protein